MLNFVYLRSSRLNVWHFWLDSCIVNKGDKFELELACCTHLEGFQVVWNYFWAQAISQEASSWPVRGTGLIVVVPKCWAILPTGLTGDSHRSDRSELSWCRCLVFFKWFACIRPGGVALVYGELACVQGGALSGFRALVWWFVLFSWAWFCLGCVEPLPLPKGSETCLLQVILLFAFLWLSIACWSFFLFISFFSLNLLYLVCCQCTHQGGDWGPCVVQRPVDCRFLVWWVIDNAVWIDSWLSIAGAGCDLTGIGAGEEQARKIVAGEASRCGEDK
jgi:hypothetical protein